MLDPHGLLVAVATICHKGLHEKPACINSIQGGNKHCPLCNEPVFMTFLHKGVAREVNALKIYCPIGLLEDGGCDFVCVAHLASRWFFP